LLLNFPVQAQRRKMRSQPATAQPVEKPCAPVALYTQKTESEQQGIDKLAAALISIKQNYRVSQTQIDLITNALLGVSDDATKAEAELVRNLAEKLTKAASTRRISNKIKSQLAEDLWMVLNVATFRSASLSATAKVGNTLYALGVKGADFDELVSALNIIIRTAGK
jgi:hypothetical protein